MKLVQKAYLLPYSFFLLIFFQLLLPTGVNAQPVPRVLPTDSLSRPVYETRRLTGTPPVVDGVLDDVVWEQVEWSQGFHQRQPSDIAPATEQTIFKILYDNRYLYVAWRAYDTEPDKVEARLGRRDDFPGDWVEINFDSFNDKRTAFSFTSSASGVRGDEFIAQDGENWDSSWNPFWFTKSRIDSLGYTVEARIPFSQLRFGKDNEQEWGLQVNRNLFRRQESSSWAKIKQTQPGWVSRFGTLTGLEGIKPRKPFELQPYVLGQIRTGGDFPENDPFDRKTDERLSVGLDGRIGITNDVAVDFTINPDFGQVEADPGAINLDGFQIFFREQRPFFVENRNIFDYNLTQAEAGGSYNSDLLFYSRRIGGSPHRYVSEDQGIGRFVRQPENTTILGAAKVSGKTQEGLSLGILTSLTEREFATIDFNGEQTRTEVEPLTAYSVGRVQQDFNDRNSSIGVMMTSVNRNLRTDELGDLHKSAFSGGVDLVHRWKDRAWYIRSNVVVSDVNGSEEAILNTQTAFERLFQRPDADHLEVDSTRTSLSGTGGSFHIGNSEGDWVFESGFTWRSPGLELNDIGFLNNAEEYNFFAWGARRWRNPFSIFNRLQWNQNIYLGWDWSGESLNRRYNTNVWGQLKSFWNFNGSITLEQMDVSKNILRGGPSIRRPPGFNFSGSVGTDGRKKGQLWAFAYRGGSYDGTVRRNGAGLNFFYQPSNALSLSVSPDINVTRRGDQYFRTVTDQNEDGTERTEYLNGSILQETFSLTLRATYNITPDFTVQYYGQPFIAKGVYSDYKKVLDPMAINFDDRFLDIQDDEISFDDNNEVYSVNDDGDEAVDYTFNRPDFNFIQFRSNLVVRWEYRPSSVLFLVWSQGITTSGNPQDGILTSLSDDLFGGDIRNTFLVKATYRWVR